ncbi:MAG: hypothetical protein ACE37K_11130 [Planctomycetota bacterium]
MSLDVVSWTNLEGTGTGGEGDIASVVFTINGVAQAPITARSRRAPNYNTQVSPRTGTTTMSDLFAFGMDLRAADWPNGTITIEVVVTTTAGSTENLPTLKVYNNKDSDTRPNTRVIYVDPVSGDNANDGLTRGTAVLQVMEGFIKAANGTGELGGAEVVLMAGEHVWAGPGNPACEGGTSDHWWVTMRVEDGATIVRNGDGMDPNGSVIWEAGLHGRFNSSDTLWLLPNTGSGHPAQLRLLMILEGSTPQVTKGDLKVGTLAAMANATWLHVEGGVFGHPAHNAVTTRWSVRYTENTVRLFDHVLDNGGSGGAVLGATCVRALGVDNAFVSFSYGLDCVIEDWTATCWQSNSDAPSLMLANCKPKGQRYGPEVRGYIDCEIDSGVSLETPDANTIVIRRAASYDVNPLANFGNPDESVQLDFADHAPELVLSERWGIALVDGAKGSGPVIFEGRQVTAAGVDGSEYTITINAPSHGLTPIADLAGHRLYCATYVGTATLEGMNQSAYVDQVHPDVIQFNGACTNSVIQGIRSEDCTGTRFFASSTPIMERVAFVDCGDAGPDKSDMNPGGGLVDCLFFHCTFHNVDFGSIAATGRTEVRGCVFEEFNYSGSGITFDRNRWGDAGDVEGTNSSTVAPWFEGDPSAAPFHLTPAAANQGNLPSSPIPFPTEYVFPDAGGESTMGVWLDVAEDYQAPEAGEPAAAQELLPDALRQFIANVPEVDFHQVLVKAGQSIPFGAALESNGGYGVLATGEHPFIGFALEDSIAIDGEGDGDRAIPVRGMGGVVLEIDEETPLQADVGDVTVTVEATGYDTFRIARGSSVGGSTVGRLVTVFGGRRAGVVFRGAMVP